MLGIKSLTTPNATTDRLMFKVDVNYKDRDSVMDSDFWAENVECREFYFIRKVEQTMSDNVRTVIMDKLRISTLNYEGIRRSRDYLNDYLTDASCDILCIQESYHLDENIDFFGTVQTDYLYTAISGVDS